MISPSPQTRLLSSAPLEPGTKVGSRRIGVFGHYGNRNLGDEAIITALIADLRRRIPDAEIRCYSLDPEDSSVRHGAMSYHVRRPAAARPAATSDLGIAFRETLRSTPREKSNADVKRRGRSWRSLLGSIPGSRAVAKGLRALSRAPGAALRQIAFMRYAYAQTKELDLLMVAGSNQFLDNFGGAWGFPWTLFRWSLAARLAGTKLAFTSVGAGPLDSPLSRLFVRSALRMAHHISFRDEPSRSLVEVGSLRGRGMVFPDLAFGLATLSSSTVSTKERSRGPLRVGINPMPLFDASYWYLTDERRYDAYVDELAKGMSEFLRRGYSVFLFGTQPMDEPVAIDILHRLDADVRSLADEETALVRTRSVNELLSVIATADVIVATRFHGALLSLVMERPVVSIAYYRKTSDLMRAVGLAEYALPLELLSVERLVAGVEAAAVASADIRQQLRVSNLEYRAQLSIQYDAIETLLTGATEVGVFRRQAATETIAGSRITKVADAVSARPAAKQPGSRRSSGRSGSTSGAHYQYFSSADGAPGVDDVALAKRSALALASERARPRRSDPNYLVLRRRRDAVAELVRELPVNVELLVLDVGGRIQPYRDLIEQGRTAYYFGLDLQMTGVVDIVARAEQLPFGTDQIDLVLCTQMLSYARDPAAVTREVHRVLKPGGWLFLSVPSFCPAYHDERWRFLPDGIQLLMSPFEEVAVIPEGFSVAGLARTANLYLDAIVRKPLLRRLAAAILFPLFNGFGEVCDRFDNNEQFTTNYSVIAHKQGPTI